MTYAPTHVHRHADPTHGRHTETHRPAQTDTHRDTQRHTETHTSSVTDLLEIVDGNFRQKHTLLLGGRNVLVVRRYCALDYDFGLLLEHLVVYMMIHINLIYVHV